jgi:protocatechuate 3,4-dioxygenase beta subunit
MTTDCRPVPRALLDFWQADDGGRYDVGGFRLRGHQFADASGGFRLETIVPAAYGGRTRHIHVRVQAPQGRVLTTQLFFPNEPANDGDFQFTRRLLMQVSGDAPRHGTFDFVLSALGGSGGRSRAAAGPFAERR